MTREMYNCYIIKRNNGQLLKFSCDKEQGICWQEYREMGWSNKQAIYKDCFEHFYVLQGNNGRIYVFCQDICGDIVLCVLEDNEWKIRTLLHMRHDVIMPIYIRAFFCLNDIYLLYNMIDPHTHCDMLVQQIAAEGIKWSAPQIISKLDCCNKLYYRIAQDLNSNLYLLRLSSERASSNEEYQLVSRTFHAKEKRWGKEEIIHRSEFLYKDYGLIIEKNIMHLLFITQEERVNKLIYKYKDIEVREGTVLFSCESIDSCALLVWNKVLWALWVSGNKLYGCYSLDNGKNFSKPEVYRNFEGCTPVKVLYQDCLGDNKSDCISNEIYAVMENGEVNFFLQELLEDSLTEDLIEENSLRVRADNSDLDIIELRDYFTNIYAKLQALQREKEALQTENKSLRDEITGLNEIIESKKAEISSLKYQLQKETEKTKIYIIENKNLKDKYSYLEKKLYAMDREKNQLKRKLAETNDAYKNLSQQLEAVKSQAAYTTEETLKRNENKKSEKAKFSLFRWLFEAEDSSKSSK